MKVFFFISGWDVKNKSYNIGHGDYHPYDEKITQ